MRLILHGDQIQHPHGEPIRNDEAMTIVRDLLERPLIDKTILTETGETLIIATI